MKGIGRWLRLTAVIELILLLYCFCQAAISKGQVSPRIVLLCILTFVMSFAGSVFGIYSFDALFTKKTATGQISVFIHLIITILIAAIYIVGLVIGL